MSIQEDPVGKSLELWRQFGEHTMQSTLSTWESGLEQSLTFQKQVQETANRALTSQFEIAAEGLKLMEQQATELFDVWSAMLRDQPAKQSGKKA